MLAFRLRHINKHFGGERGFPRIEVLHDINLDIHAGEFVAIMGTSGSGKSTLMNILGCLDRPSSGQYLFYGNDVIKLNHDQLAILRRNTFGFVFQFYHLIPTESVIENVELPALYAGMTKRARQKRAFTILQRLGLEDHLHKRPSQLSGGQQQRTSIARALMNGGKVILADEPTGALDSETGEQVMRFLAELADQGHTVILVTHDQKLAQRSRRIIQIQDGRILKDHKLEHIAEGGTATSKFDGDGESYSVSKIQARSRHRTLLKEELRNALRVLRTNRTRTILTLLGIIIGVASVIIMLAVGEGTKRKVMAQLTAMGPNMVHVGSTVPPNGGPRGVITKDDIAAIAQLPEILRYMPFLVDTALVRHDAVHRDYEIWATTDVLPEMYRWPVALGRFFTSEENQNVAPVVVLGHLAYKLFFPNGANPLGQKILIKNAPYEIIGVMSEKGAESGESNHDERLYVPHRTGTVRVFPRQRDRDYLVVEAINSDSVQLAEQQLSDLLLLRHGRYDFWVNNAAARHLAVLDTRNNMTLMLGLIAAISLLVGGIGVMNVMLMTVRERVKEIGIRVANGARQQDIHRQFITEAALVSLLGGTIGALISILFIGVLALASVPVALSFIAIFGAVLSAIITGVLFGMMPAKRAARLDPVAALTGD